MPYNNLQEQGRPVKILDEGIPLSSNVESIDFAGAGVVATNVGDDVEVNISGSSSGAEVVSETPTGDIDGTNADFVVAHTPTAGTLKVYLNGSRQAETNDYTLTNETITFVNPPMQGSVILVDYYYS